MCTCMKHPHVSRVNVPPEWDTVDYNPKMMCQHKTHMHAFMCPHACVCPCKECCNGFFRVMSAVMWLEVYSLFTGPSDLYLSSPRPFALCAAYISQDCWGQSVQGKDPLHLFYGPIPELRVLLSISIVCSSACSLVCSTVVTTVWNIHTFFCETGRFLLVTETSVMVF